MGCVCAQELARRGVAAEVAEAALRSVFGQGLDLASHLDELADEQHAAAAGIAGSSSGAGSSSMSSTISSAAASISSSSSSISGSVDQPGGGGVGSSLLPHLAALVGPPAAAPTSAASAFSAPSSSSASPERQLLEQARRQHAQSLGLPADARRRRLVGWLQRRGHRWEDISRLLHQLDKEEASATIDAAASVDLPDS